MTIIAWKDGILAADTMMSTAYGIRTGDKQKLFHGCNDAGRFIVGISGRTAFIGPLLAWLKFPKGPLPTGDYTALVAYENGDLILIEDGGGDKLEPSSPRAIGAGAEFAYGAMSAGASALDAVKRTIEGCIYCGGEANAFDCTKWEMIA